MVKPESAQLHELATEARSSKTLDPSLLGAWRWIGGSLGQVAPQRRSSPEALKPHLASAWLSDISCLADGLAPIPALLTLEI